MQKIQITITPDGETKIEASGFTGDECIKATAPIEQALGVPEGDRVRKLEANSIGVAVTQFVKGGGK